MRYANYVYELLRRLAVNNHRCYFEFVLKFELGDLLTEEQIEKVYKEYMQFDDIGIIGSDLMEIIHEVIHEETK